jgi:diacylglycerol kinase (ATP)
MRSDYCIVANPVSGKLGVEKKAAVLKQVAQTLPAPIYGLDTDSPGAFEQCLRERAEKCDVLIVAGGDGSFSLALNTVDLLQTTLAFLPFGTGNALTHALDYRGGVVQIAARIKEGRIHRCDLIDCDHRKKAFMVSLGVDGEAIRCYERYRKKGARGLKAHAPAIFNAVFKNYRPTGGTLEFDGELQNVSSLWSLMIVKQPFFGMGLKVVPQARWDDGYLHTMAFSSGLPEIVAGFLTGFTIGNRMGRYRKMKRLTVRLENPLTLQVDGELGWTADLFSFSVLPGALKLKF